MFARPHRRGNRLSAAGSGLVMAVDTPSALRHVVDETEWQKRVQCPTLLTLSTQFQWEASWSGCVSERRFFERVLGRY